MATVIALTLAWGSRSPQNLEGRATYYAPGLMETVAANRGYDLDGYLGGVALNRKGDLGRAVWLEWDNAVEGPFLVVDCAQERHYHLREEQNRVVEVDAATARRHWGYGVGPAPVKGYFDSMVSGTWTPCYE